MFNLTEIPEPEDRLMVYHAGRFIDQAARKALCAAAGVEFKEHDHSQDVGKEVVRPSLFRGMVVCGPCGNKVIEFTHYCEVRGDRSYGPSGGGWEVIVCKCPEHGNAVLRAMWKDLVAHPDDLIVAFSEQMALPESPVEIEQRQKRVLIIDEAEDGPIIDV